jgi:hypothetical protein
MVDPHEVREFPGLLQDEKAAEPRPRLKTKILALNVDL